MAASGMSRTPGRAPERPGPCRWWIAELGALGAAPEEALDQRGAPARADRLAEGALGLRRGPSGLVLVIHAATLAT